MKILSTTLLLSLMTVFATAANAEANGSGNIAQQSQTRLANCNDCLDAGYRRGYADALENTPAGSSSVTTPLSYRKPVYVAVAAPKNHKPPVYHNAHHVGHGHHTQAQILDCERTDLLNRAAKPVTTVIATQKAHHHTIPTKRPHAPVKQHTPTYIKHGNHFHHTHAEKADCALTDALNRASKTVSTVISSTSHKPSPINKPSPIKQYMKQTYTHGNHSHHSEAERADCALTDALNRESVTRVIHKH